MYETYLFYLFREPGIEPSHKYRRLQHSDASNNFVFAGYIDMGVIIAGQKKDAVITIRNPTSQYVRIESIRGDCNCVNINTCPTGVSVGESTKITLTYDSEPDKQFKGSLYKVILLKASVKPFLQSVLLKMTIV